MNTTLIHLLFYCLLWDSAHPGSLCLLRLEDHGEVLYTRIYEDRDALGGTRTCGTQS